MEPLGSLKVSKKLSLRIGALKPKDRYASEDSCLNVVLI